MVQMEERSTSEIIEVPSFMATIIEEKEEQASVLLVLIEFIMRNIESLIMVVLVT